MMNPLPMLALCVLASASVLRGAQFEGRYISLITVAAGPNSNPGECPSESVREELRATAHERIRMHLQNITQNTTQGQATCRYFNQNLHLCLILVPHSKGLINNGYNKAL